MFNFRLPDIEKMNARRNVRGLIRVLKKYKKYPGLLEPAAKALGELGDVRAVEPLNEVLQCGYNSTRLVAVIALGKLGDKRAVKPLLAVTQLKATTESEDYTWRHSFPTAEEAYNAINQNAVNSIVKIGTAGVEMLVSALNEHNERAAEALGRIGDARAVEPLIAAYQGIRYGQHVPFRVSIARALGMIGDARAVPPLIKTIETTSESPSSDMILYRSEEEAVIEALGKLGAPAYEALLPLLNSEADLVRHRAVEALGAVGDGRAFQAIIELLHDPRFVQDGIKSLGKLGDRRALPHLLEQLNDPANPYRREVVIALGDLGDSEAVDALVAVLKMSWYEDLNCHFIRKDAAEALGKIGTRRAVGPLIAALKASSLGKVRRWDGTLDSFEHSEITDLRVKSAQALGKIGNTGAVSALKAAIHTNAGRGYHGGGDLVAQAASEALKQIAAQGQ